MDWLAALYCLCKPQPAVTTKRRGRYELVTSSIHETHVHFRGKKDVSSPHYGNRFTRGRNDPWKGETFSRRSFFLLFNASPRLQRGKEISSSPFWKDLALEGGFVSRHLLNGRKVGRKVENKSGDSSGWVTRGGPLTRSHVHTGRGLEIGFSSNHAVYRVWRLVSPLVIHRAGLSRFTRNFSPPTSDPARENPPFSTFNLNSPLTNIPVLYHPLPLSCIIFITVILGLFVTLGRSITMN